MSTPITLGFQNNTPGASVVSFNVDVPSDGKKHRLSDLIGKATNGGNPVKVPADSSINEVQLSKPNQVSKDGSVDVEYPSGVKDNRTSAALTATKTFAKITAPVKEVDVIVRK